MVLETLKDIVTFPVRFFRAKFVVLPTKRRRSITAAANFTAALVAAFLIWTETSLVSKQNDVGEIRRAMKSAKMVTLAENMKPLSKRMEEIEKLASVAGAVSSAPQLAPGLSA
mmetsp:Transcript_13800/g.20909  ORF Transcript_13800/g.20909 Transcript_13800/m.20909 type:complete len:113 (+) Transcript_13800:155-493(+)